MTNRTQDWLGGIALDTIPANIFDTYERAMVPAVFEPWGRRLVEAAELKRGDRVLDVACATGIVARLATEHVGRDGAVTGLDLMGGMLEVARGLEPSIDWVEADAASMPLPDGSFDVVLCQQGLQFFPDKVAALRETRRVLTTEGRVMVSVWRSIDTSPAVAALQRAIESHAPDAAGFLPFAFSMTNGDDLREALRDAGFDDIRLRIEIGAARFGSVGDFLATYLGSTPVGGIISALPDDRRAALADDVVHSVSRYTDDYGLTFPQETHVASGRRH